MRVADGCKGCGTRWDAPGREAQCSTCKRCLGCCSRVSVAGTCAQKEKAREAAMSTGELIRRRRAQRRYHEYMQGENLKGGK